MSGERVYGIDLGTTYSCIAYVDEHGKPVVLQNAEGEATTPSVVYFESANNIVVGQTAKEVAAIYPDLCVSTVKRVMGDPKWVGTFYEQTYKPQDISSFILRKLVKDAERVTGDTIREVVITCPAYFGFNEKEATRQAGLIAGLNVRYVIPEPTAAAIAYGIEQTEDQVILVYDLGGGTFDVTLIEIKAGEITVICTGGDRLLGGKDWDDCVVSYFAQAFAAATGTPAAALLDDKETYQELLTAAEKCKKMLHSSQKVTEAVRFGGERVKVDLTRETFDQITAQLLERTLMLTEQEIEKARQKGHAKIDKLLLVGGSTYMQQVVEAVKQRFPFEVRQFDPNQAVAKGAAIFGFRCYLEEQIKIRVASDTGQAPEKVDLPTVDPRIVAEAQSAVARDQGMPVLKLKDLVETTITNVTSKSFGVVAFDHDDRQKVSNLIEVNQQVPKTITQQFATRVDRQVSVEIQCMENLLAQAQTEISESTEIGKATLEFGKPLPQGSPIEITFDLGPDGLLKVHGRDLTTGREIDTKIKTDAIMSEEEVAAATSRNRSLQVA